MYYLCKVCFVCLRDKNLYNVLDKNKESFETITFVLPELTITEAEIPVHICSSCNKNLQNIYKLKKLCLENFYERFGRKSQVNCDKNEVVIKQENECFICLKDKKLRNFFDEFENDSFNEIAFGIPEIVVADANFSPKVCFKCTSKLLNLYKLKKKYLESYCKWIQFPDKLGDNDNEKLSNLNIKLDKIQEVIKTEYIEMGQFEIVIKKEANDMDMEDTVPSIKQNEFDNIGYNIQDDFKLANLQTTIAKTENVSINEEISELEEPLVKTEQEESEIENIEGRRSDFVSPATSRKNYSIDHEKIEEYYDEEYVSESEEDIYADNSDDDKDFRLDSDCVDDSDSNISENNVQNTVSNIWDDDFTDKKLPESNKYEHENSDEEDFRGFEKVILIPNCCKSENNPGNINKSHKSKAPLTNKNNLTSKKNKQKLPEISESEEISQHINIIPDRQGGNNVSCSMCRKTYLSRRALRTHVDNIHRRIRTKWSFKCILCKKEVAGKDHLKVHYFMHLNIKPFQCTICGFKVRSKVHLLGHLKKHTNNKDFKCSICGKIFQNRSEMKVHKNIVHFGRVTHQCNVCKKYFVRIADLREHLNLHMELYHYCDICNKRFAAKRFLIKHKLVDHKIKQ